MNNSREALTLEKIGARIRIKRESLGMTQQELADMVNVTRNTISRYENGETEIGVIMLKNIADALSVTVLWLLFGFDYENDIYQNCNLNALFLLHAQLNCPISVADKTSRM